MKFTAGETLTIIVQDVTLLIKVEDASKGDVISARVEEVKSGGGSYQPGQVYEFNRSGIIEA